MSRSCQSATFSSPAIAPPRTTRASPQIRSETIGFRLCGIADEPFWPLPNGSSTSRTSVRARCRISSANRSSEAASERERVQHLGMAVALEDLRRARSRLEPEPLAGDPLDLGIRGRVGADRARELADPHAFERPSDAGAVALEREGPAGELEAEGRRLGVDAVRAPDRQSSRGAPRRARRRRRRPARSRRGSSAPASRIWSESAVSSDVRGGQAVVEPAPLLAERLGDRIDERGDVVVRPRLDLRDALRRRRRRLARESCRPPRAVRRRSPPSRPARRARPRASAPASLSSDQIADMAGRE